MDCNEYQKRAVSTAIYPATHKVTYPLIGLAGEVGELCNSYKKVIRDSNGVITEEKRKQLKGELGGVSWYLAAVAADLGFTLEEILTYNLEQLQSRKERGVLGGSGDNR
jgi:NTP pyrophosphatase (non-canonical NTP hydrolase)